MLANNLAAERNPFNDYFRSPTFSDYGSVGLLIIISEITLE